MKKVLISCLLFLSACASDSTVYKHYPVPDTNKKARLFIAKSRFYPEQWYKNMLASAAVQKAWQKHFVKSDEASAEFVLTQNDYKDKTGGGTMTWAFFSGFTLGVVPFFGKTPLTYSYTLKRTENQRTVFLSDVNVSARAYFGWLMIPAVVFPDVSFGGSFDDRAMVSAIEEAASLVYDKKSKLYEKVEQRNWGRLTGDGTKKENDDPADNADMDSVW